LTKGIVMPDEIPGSVAQDMKKIMNEDAASTFKQLDSTKWNADQQISRSGRDATKVCSIINMVMPQN